MSSENDQETKPATGQTGLKEYPAGAAFTGRMGRTIAESEPAWPAPVRAKPGAPNVLFIVLDDTGFGQLGCYGSPINTPNAIKASHQLTGHPRQGSDGTYVKRLGRVLAAY
jgi:hypothetical protein